MTVMVHIEFSENDKIVFRSGLTSSNLHLTMPGRCTKQWNASPRSFVLEMCRWDLCSFFAENEMMPWFHSWRTSARYERSGIAGKFQICVQVKSINPPAWMLWYTSNDKFCASTGKVAKFEVFSFWTIDVLRGPETQIWSGDLRRLSRAA